MLLAAVPAFTSRRPRYGGTLLVELGAVVNSVDPSVASANPEEERAKLQIESLIYDHRNADGSFSDPGPFHLVEWEPGKHLIVGASKDYKRGRPFLDAIDFQLGRSAANRLVDIELDKTDMIDVPADQARRAAERGVRISGSKPDELIALVFIRSDEQTGDHRFREAISRSIDRPAIVNFILQKEGEPGGGLLPQWSSGTAFLFSTARDLDGAKKLRSEIGPSPKFGLGYDADDPQLRAIAERIAVNTWEAGVPITTEPISKPELLSKIAMRLDRLDMPSPDPRATLVEFLDQLHIPAAADDADEGLPDPATPQQIYDREAAVIQTYSVIPIAWIPHVYALSPRVRDWNPPGPGEPWPLADVWLDLDASPPQKATP
jgi:Bacterial extracellular solute-binding proteins, family 5 Middle